ncbi:glycosyltransferase [Cyanosarcina cf. burmensis CCALA 770]|nr:glycosyltransferase [Cyanosarcina cf. burmensis CCALA 770]
MKQSYYLLGVWVNALTISDLNRLIAEAVKHDERWIIANHNLHSLCIYHKDPKMRAFYDRADYIHVDGMSLILLGRLLGLALRREHRVTYVDWTDHLMAVAAQQGWRIFYLGGQPGVVERGASILRQRFPGLQLATAHGYFDVHPSSSENRAVLDAIAAYQPHVLMLGMGMPRQEHWILDNLDRLSANAILTAGAAMDYVAGAVPTPPRWAGQFGLEWLFRLLAEPQRLWRRYSIEPWLILRLFATELLVKER